MEFTFAKSFIDFSLIVRDCLKILWFCSFLDFIGFIIRNRRRTVSLQTYFVQKKILKN